MSRALRKRRAHFSVGQDHRGGGGEGIRKAEQTVKSALLWFPSNLLVYLGRVAKSMSFELLCTFNNRRNLKVCCRNICLKYNYRRMVCW
jgi:hypothetical protein